MNKMPLSKKTWSRLMPTLAAVFLTLGFFTLIPLESAWNVGMLLGGGRSFDEAILYLRFNLIFLPLITVLILGALAYRPQAFLYRPMYTILFGAILGYSSGLVSYLCSILLVDDGVQRFLNTTRLDLSVQVFLLIPIAMLTWLFGAIAAFNVYWLSARFHFE